MRKYFNFKRFLIFLVCLILILSITLTAIFLKIKPLIFKYAKSYAETLFLNATNISVVEILKDENISYDSIAMLSKDSEGCVKSLEINTNKINLLKSLISNKASDYLINREYYDLFIPLGSLLGSEYTLGMGPRIKFKMQATCTVFVDFKSAFYSAGINQVLHQILIKIKINGNILMLECSDTFSVETSVIAAETVIVGITPDAFTNVIEGAGTSSIVGDIFDYGHLEADSNGE